MEKVKRVLAWTGLLIMVLALGCPTAMMEASEQAEAPSAQDALAAAEERIAELEGELEALRTEYEELSDFLDQLAGDSDEDDELVLTFDDEGTEDEYFTDDEFMMEVTETSYADNVPELGDGEDPADETIVATVGDREVTYGQVKEAFLSTLSQYEMYYDLSDPEVVTELMESELKYIVDQLVMEHKAGELNLLKQRDEFADEAQEIYEEVFAQYLDAHRDEDGELPEGAEEEVTAFLELYEYTPEYIEEQLWVEDLYNTLHEMVAQDVIVDEDALKDMYEANVEDARQRIAEDPTSFEYEMIYGNPLYYYPEGYRAVKHILLLFEEEDQEKAAELFYEREELGEDDARRLEIDGEIADIVAKIQDKVDSVSAKIEAGEDFDALIAEYGEDLGMEEAEEGYLVCADSVVWNQEFIDGSMALENIGDVSGPIVSDFGVHFIKYLSDVEPGAAPLDELYSVLEDEVRTVAEEDAFGHSMEAWEKEADTFIYNDRLFVKEADAAE